MSDRDNDVNDDRMMQALADALRSDQPPASLVAAAKDSLTWRTIDEELAALVFDSARDELAGVRGTGTEVRSVDFEVGDTSVAIEISEQTLSGQITPSALSIVVESPSGTVETEPSAMGWFEVTVPFTGPLRLRFRSEGRVVVTDWFAI
jgi:hypothetical protein